MYSLVEVSKKLRENRVTVFTLLSGAQVPDPQVSLSTSVNTRINQCLSLLSWQLFRVSKLTTTAKDQAVKELIALVMISNCTQEAHQHLYNIIFSDSESIEFFKDEHCLNSVDNIRWIAALARLFNKKRIVINSCNFKEASVEQCQALAVLFGQMTHIKINYCSLFFNPNAHHLFNIILPSGEFIECMDISYNAINAEYAQGLRVDEKDLMHVADELSVLPCKTMHLRGIMPDIYSSVPFPTWLDFLFKAMENTGTETLDLKENIFYHCFECDKAKLLELVHKAPSLKTVFLDKIDGGFVTGIKEGIEKILSARKSEYTSHADPVETRRLEHSM